MPHERLHPSFNLDKEKLNELKQILPEVFEDGKINWDVLKECLGDYIEDEDSDIEHFGLFWPGKREARRLTAIPSNGTLIPVKGEGINEEETGNIFIEGENLEVLKILQKSYAGKIKMIYIDPPYNTGNDFIFDDNFTEVLEDYLKRTNQIDDQGKSLTTNKRSDGRFHSKWLSMMYPRLKLARELLKDDGVLFVSIDDNENSNLRLILDEIFGQENYLGDIIWNSTKSVTNTALLSVSHTYNLVYFKNIEYFKKNRFDFRLPDSPEGFENPDNDPRGPWKADPFQVEGERPNQLYEITNPKTGQVYRPNPGCSWKNDFDKFKELFSEGRIVFGVSGDAGPQRKRFWSEAQERGRVSKSLWTDIDTTSNATTYLEKLMGKKVFTNPKPVDLIQRFLELGTSKNDEIVLDFFGGSGTTADAVIRQNMIDLKGRTFIFVTLPEKIKEDTQVGKNAISLGYNTISDIAKDRVLKVIETIKNDSKVELKSELTSSIGFKVFKLTSSNFIQWKDYKGNELNKLESLFSDSNLIADWKFENLLTEIILIEGFPLNSNISKLEEITSNNILRVTSNHCQHDLLICLDKKIEDKSLSELKLIENDVFICLDDSISDSDKIKLSDKGFLKTI